MEEGFSVYEGCPNLFTEYLLNACYVLGIMLGVKAQGK